MKIKHLVTTLFVVCALTCGPLILNAQFDDPDPKPTSAPFDGGISLMIAAGIGYAVKRKHDLRKKEGEVKDGESSL